MKKLKFVTAFYAFHANKPFWGHNGRRDRYLYSLKTLCNMNQQVICYTDEGEKGFDDLKNFKEEHNLENLTIKIFPLQDNPYQSRVEKIRTLNSEFYDNPGIGNYSRSSQIYWMKFHFLSQEFEPGINLYWIDAGLACEGMFPSRFNPFGLEEDYKTFYGSSYQDNKHKLYDFTLAFTPQTVDRIVNYTKDDLVFLSRKSVTDCNLNLFNSNIEEFVDYSINTNKNGFPIGGFFGGNSDKVLKLVDEAKRCIELILSKEYYLCGDEEILTYFLYKNENLVNVWSFDTFYHEEYTEIVNSPEILSFYKFFTG